MNGKLERTGIVPVTTHIGSPATSDPIHLGICGIELRDVGQRVASLRVVKLVGLIWTLTKKSDAFVC